MAVVLLAVVLGVAVVVAAVALVQGRAASRRVDELQTLLAAAEAKVSAGTEREIAAVERYEVAAVEREHLEGTVRALEDQQLRLEAALARGSDERGRLDEEIEVLRAELANAREAAREADAAAVAAVAQADATHEDLVRSRSDAESLREELEGLRAAPTPSPDEPRPEAAPILVEGLWALERARTERTWRQSVALDAGGPGPFGADDEPARVAVEVEAAAVREDVGAVIVVEWQLEGPLAATDGLLLVRSAQELLALGARTVEDGVLVVDREDGELVLSLLGPGRVPVEGIDSTVRLPTG